MKLVITTNDGTVIGTIEGIEEFSLHNPVSRAFLCEKITRLIKIGKKKEK